MGEAVKIGISLTPDEFETLNEESSRHGESRSAYLRRLIREDRRRREDQAAVDAYVESYRKYPETEDEMETALALAVEAFGDDEGWE